jgi:hypothetical protein
MYALIRTLVMAIIVMLPAMLLAAAEPTPDFNARYYVNKAGVNVISLKISLTRSPGKIEYRSTAEPTSMASWFFGDHRIDEYSGLKPISGEIVPLEYRYIHQGTDENENEHYLYDWRRHIAHVNYRGEERKIKIPDGTLDTSSLQLALMLDARAGHKKLLIQ